MEVAPGVHRIEAPLGERYVSLYLLEAEDSAALFDTGTDDSPSAVLAPYLSTIGRSPASIDWVITSHADFDHFGGNATMRELAPAAKFGCHELDQAMVEDVEKVIDDRYGEFELEHDIGESAETKTAIRRSTRCSPMQITFQGGERLRLGRDWSVEIVHTPGHSRGHLSVFDPRSRALMISDAILWSTLCTRDGKPAFPPTYRYVDAYLATISRVLSLRPELLLTAHFPVFRGQDVYDFLAESRGFAERLDLAIRNELGASRSAVKTRSLVELLAPQLGTWDEAASLALVYPVLGHLERLERYGLIDRALVDGRANWTWRA